MGANQPTPRHPDDNTMTANNNRDNRSRQHIFQVSELNKNIKRLLEDTFPFVWISGEISNFRTPSSGHCYFTLKDATAQISAVIFRGQAAALKFRPEDGISIIGLGRISVYEPRGTYQVIFEYIEPKGIGALQIAFEKLKQKLADEGLFDTAHKLPLPTLPRMVSVVTSPTGAAVRDFIRVAHRRFPNLHLQIVPVAVQGDRAPGEITAAVELLCRIGKADVIVLARGGGSIEDLCAFNDEALARAIFASRIPVVSAVGHETDFTIADFVADLRAPTPSAAAEMVVPQKEMLQNQFLKLNQELYGLINNSLDLNRKNIDGISARIVHPKRRLQDMRLRLDDLAMRLASATSKLVQSKKEHFEYRHSMLMHLSPARSVSVMKEHLAAVHQAMVGQMKQVLRQGRNDAAQYGAMLETLNPMAILKRGYSITRTPSDKVIVRSADAVAVDQPLEILLGSGRLDVIVNKIEYQRRKI